MFIERKIAGRMFGEQLRHFLALDGWTELRNQVCCVVFSCQVWKSWRAPSDWKYGIILPFYKIMNASKTVVFAVNAQVCCTFWPLLLFTCTSVCCHLQQVLVREYSVFYHHLPPLCPVSHNAFIQRCHLVPFGAVCLV